MKTNYLEKAENKDYFWKPKLFFNQRRKIYVLYWFSDYGRKAQEIHSQEFKTEKDVMKFAETKIKNSPKLFSK
jgi:hypothetical protein